MARRSYSAVAAKTKLSGDINASAASLTLVDGTGYPAANGVLTLERDLTNEEKVLYTTRAGNVCSGLTRGFDGTPAVTHVSGTSVEHTLSATDLDEANAHIWDATRDDHSQYNTPARHALITHTAAMLGTDSVTTVKIVDANVTTAKIADASVTTPKVADAAITLPKMGPSSVGTAQLIDNNVTLAKMGAGSVGTSQLVNSAVTGAKIAAGQTIQNPVIASGSTTGNFSVGGPTHLNDQALYLRADNAHYIQWATVADGPLIEGNQGAFIRAAPGGGKAIACFIDSGVSGTPNAVKAVREDNSAFQKFQASQFEVISDSVFKQDITESEDGPTHLDQINDTPIYTYSMSEETHPEQFPNPEVHLGFVAQDVPEAIQRKGYVFEKGTFDPADPESQPVVKEVLAYDLAGALAMAWSAIKELSAQVKELQGAK